MVLLESILNSIKKQCGLTEDYNAFDADIILLINSALNILNQVGIGKTGFYIEDENSKWEDFLGESSSELNMAKSYVYLRTRLIFDPPSNSFLLDALKEQYKELEWRLNVQVDPPFPEDI